MTNTSIIVFCDFDGTITKQDVIDLLLEKLADPEWLNIESRWIEGEISSRECLSQQIPLIKGGYNKVENLLKEVEVDSTFKPFSNWCFEKGIPLYIASEGLNEAINCLFFRESIKVTSIWSNKLEINKSGDFSIKFPYPSKSNSCKLGLCKCDVMESISTTELKVVIGDGLNDTCWAQKADLVFAKSKLLNYCESKKIPFQSFQSFKDIMNILNEILKGNLSVIAGEVIKNPSRKNSYVREN